MKYFMGLDLSVRGPAGVVVDEEGVVVEYGTWGVDLHRDATNKQRIERLAYIVEKIVCMGRRAKKISEEGGFFVGIEDYAFSRKGAQNDLGEIQGAAKLQLWVDLNIIASRIAASSARKKVLGKGRFSKGKAGKKEIIKAVCDRGFRVSDDNVADAYVIAECLRILTREMKDGR